MDARPVFIDEINAFLLKEMPEFLVAGIQVILGTDGKIEFRQCFSFCFQAADLDLRVMV